MSSQSLNLPINIPWCQIAVTEQMMDKDHGGRQYPAPWRTSMAISAYEPATESLPEEFSGKRITYLKVTCTITGYQPTREDTDRYVDLDDGSTTFRQITDEYLACYGARLNIAIHPANTQEAGPVTQVRVGDDDLANYPHIIALEPKNRDLYQSVTENGELLTASKANVSTDKTLVQTQSTETGVNISGTIGEPKEWGVSAGLTHTWGESDKDSSTIQTDASRERRETQGTTTQLSQMYNLLKGYHQGTNRAAFLMLPRPHTLQSTDRRTFVQGVRQIEGIQEFMLIVERPAKVNSLCIKAYLETGHFPEDPDYRAPEPQYDEHDVRIDLERKVSNDWSPNPFNSFKKKRSLAIEEAISIAKLAEDDTSWELDHEKGTQGVSQTILPRDTTGPGNLAKLPTNGYSVEPPSTLRISAKITSPKSGSTTFHRRYTVHLRKQRAEPAEPHTTVADLLITQRGLDVCIRSGDGCPKVVRDESQVVDPTVGAAQYRESIVDERKVSVNSSLLTGQAFSDSPLPATRELLRQVQYAMTTSGRSQSRYPAGRVGFLDSDYFKNRLVKTMSRGKLGARLQNIPGLPDEVLKGLGKECTVADALHMSLSTFSKKTGLSLEKATTARLRLLGMDTVSNGRDVDDSEDSAG